MKQKLTIILLLMLFSFGINAQTIINFDTDVNWIPDGSLTAYANHGYAESGVLFAGTNVLRNTTTVQDLFPGALGTYSFRLRNAADSKLNITVATGGVSTFSFAVRRGMIHQYRTIQLNILLTEELFGIV